jgi:DNA-directed RNA polymerase specialized sigma24 family protein
LFWSAKPKVANFRAEYAKHADFCDAFKNDMKPLYLLAFLLTANHKEAEQCLVSTVDEASQEQAVFKEWARSWIKRRLIEKAIETVSPASARKRQKRDLWRTGQHETQRERQIDTVTNLDPFERFVFVMSILERYSNWDCAVLLGCSISTVAHTRMRALHRLRALATLLSRDDGLPMPRLTVTA